MKDATNGAAIIEFYGLKTKMYLFIKEDHKGDKKAEGVNKKILFEKKKRMWHEMKRIQSKPHYI